MSQHGDKRTTKTQKTLFETLRKKSHGPASQKPLDNAENDSSTSHASSNIPSSSSAVDLEANPPLLVTAVPSHGNSPLTTTSSDDRTHTSHAVDSESQRNALKLPQPTTLEKWRKKYEWLVITERNTMVCEICVSQKEKILLKNPSSQMAFITGTTNFKTSALKDHARSECHATGISETEHQKALAVGDSLPPKHVVHEVPTNSAIATGMQKMNEKERTGVKKLMDIAYFIALKGRPFTDFKDHIELEKLHGVKFDTSSYENETSCREFIKSIACYLFDEDVRKKMCRVNFIAILIDGTTDRAIKEQEVLYAMFVDPDTHKPTLTYFECLIQQP